MVKDEKPSIAFITPSDEVVWNREQSRRFPYQLKGVFIFFKKEKNSKKKVLMNRDPLKGHWTPNWITTKSWSQGKKSNSKKKKKKKNAG